MAADGIGPLVGAGRSADVFDAGGGRVLRRYRNPKADAEYEARVMRHVRSFGFPVPEVFDASGPDLVMERVSGPTMLDALRRSPRSIPAQARLLADLHNQLHSIPAVDWMPESFGPGNSVLHLDLHPLNVLLTDSGPVVIDWPNTRRGQALADVAHTWMVLSTAVPSGRLDQALAAVARSVLVRHFLAGFPLDGLRGQLPAVADRWLADRNIGPRELAATERFMRRQAG